MSIKTTYKRVSKGQAIIDLKKQISDSFKVINSAILNIEASAKEMKIDSDFSLDEIQEFKGLITYALSELDKNYHKWQEIFENIVLE